MSKKKRNRKYNPNKGRDLVMKKQAERCVLYHWDSAVYSDPQQQFVMVGPADAILWAATRPTCWVVQVVACFFDDDGDYYEDVADLTSSKCILADGDMEESVEQVAKQLKDGGNARHYFDTVWIARMKTPRLALQIEDAQWNKDQAAWREKQITSDQFNRLAAA
ncbi:MAG: hypothetical protein ACRBBW_12945 [Cellvibrionaceae bacterium]